MQRHYRSAGIVLAMIIGIFFLFNSSGGVSAEPALQEGSPVILAAGDIAKCSAEEDALTSYLLDINEGTIITLGDNAYEVGSIREFEDCFGSTWGRHKDRIRPSPGNHEYGSGDINGYFEYFGDVATPLEPGCRKSCKGYYSFDIGEWHLISLNSEIDNTAGSEQEQWLRADLAANDSLCTLAYWHRPRYTSRRTDGAAHDLFQALYDYGADVVLSGHDHHYERFGPQDNGAQEAPDRGVRQFVVGTGGATLRDIRFIQPSSEVRETETWGILKMTLHPDSYDWEFIPIPGQTWTDSGSAKCVSAPDRPAPPAVTQTIAETTPAAAPVGATASVAATAAKPSASGAEHVVASGDTLFGIALGYGLEWTELADANDLTEQSILQIGQVLRLPGAAPLQPTTAGPVESTVEEIGTAVDDEAIAETGAPTEAEAVAETEAATPSSTASTNRTGSGSSPAVHIIVSGDTIINIALANDLDWQELLELNGLDEDSILRIGQKISLE
jgi:LysM repeat protein